MSEVGRMETTEAMKLTHYDLGIKLGIIRLGYIMSDDSGAYPLLASLARIGWGGRVDDGYQCLPMVHVSDAVRAIIAIACTSSMQGIYNLTIPEMASMNELVKAFATSTSRSQRRLPKFIIRLLTGRAINLLEQNCKVVPRRLMEAGFSFNYSDVESIVRDLQSKSIGSRWLRRQS